MKKILFLIITTTLIYIFYNINRNKIPQQNILQPTPTPPEIIKIETKYKSVYYENTEYSYIFSFISNDNPVRLITNYSEKLSFNEIVRQYKCRSAINGGFYDENNNPLGLIVKDTLETAPYKQNALFNGIIYENENSVWNISDSYPNEKMVWAIQTGPILIYEFNPIFLKIKNDQTERRMVAGIDDKGQMIFIAVFDKDNLYKGPLLSDLPEIIESISLQEKVRIKSAINHDGGTASAIKNENESLQEMTPVGSVLCAK